MTPRLSFLLLPAVAMLAIGHAVAAPLAYDTFEYMTAGATLNGQKGGHGWFGGWKSQNAAKVSNDEITYTSNGITRGGGRSLEIAASGDNVLSRNISAQPDLSGADYFVSFIFQIKDESETGDVSGEVFTGWQCLDAKPNTTVDNIGMTGFHGRAGARVNSLSKMMKAPLRYGVTYFLVIKYGGWNGLSYTTTTVWLNPGKGDEGSDSANRIKVSSDAGSEGFLGLQVRSFGLSESRYYLFDDVCVGRSWQEVTDALTPQP